MLQVALLLTFKVINSVLFCQAYIMLLQRPRTNDGNTSTSGTWGDQHALHEQNKGGKEGRDTEATKH